MTTLPSSYELPRRRLLLCPIVQIYLRRSRIICRMTRKPSLVVKKRKAQNLESEMLWTLRHSNLLNASKIFQVLSDPKVLVILLDTACGRVLLSVSYRCTLTLYNIYGP